MPGYLNDSFILGPGCGGELYNYGGSFSSPGYPNTEQNSSDCTWTVSVPMNLYVAINFNGKIVQNLVRVTIFERFSWDL